ncbi:MAG: MFS transporter [Veillonella sp.]|uniref:MFS transporter n=1 Tax=Veillonella sp. TaxID=1926307 RepID=UPI0025FF6E86|nr:MFS transporter [Veillonella sp.]MBS4913000.1 MFS transporter [Veillonella sp.]
MEAKKEKLWTLPFMLDTVINLLVFLIYYLLIVIIAVVAKDTLHATSSQAGLAVGIYIIGTVVARIFAGRMVTTLGSRKVLFAGLFIYLISTALYFYMPNLIVLDTVRFINGFAYGITSTATSTIVASVIPKSRRGEGINYYGLSTSLAAAIGPFLGIFLLSETSFNFIIGLCVVLVALCVVGAFMMKYEEPVFSEAVRKEESGRKISDYLEPRVNSITLVSILVGFAYSGILGFMASYTREINMVQAGTWFFVVYAVIITLTRPSLGLLFDRKGENYVLYPCFISLAIGILLLAYATSGWMILVSALFVGLGYGTYMSNGQAVVVKMVPFHRIGIATSTYFIALDLGLGFGPYALGGIKELIGFTNMFLLTAVVAIVAFICYHFLYGRLLGTSADPALKAQKEELEIRNQNGEFVPEPSEASLS